MVNEYGVAYDYLSIMHYGAYVSTKTEVSFYGEVTFQQSGNQAILSYFNNTSTVARNEKHPVPITHYERHYKRFLFICCSSPAREVAEQLSRRIPLISTG